VFVAEHRVRVHAKFGREVLRRRKSLPRLRLAVGDRTPNLRSDLLVEVEGIGWVDLDVPHYTSHSNFISARRQP
jgi:hypothetical protein